MRRELFLAFFPIQQIKTVLFLQFILVAEMTMQKRTIYLRNWQGKIVSTSSFPQEEYEQGSLEEEPSLVMYEFLRSLVRKQCRYPFQLLKQFVLFSDEESSIQVGYKHMRYELEIIEVNIEAVCDLFRQKLLVHGFITIKHAYEKRLRFDEAYYNQQNLQQMHETMLLITEARQSWLKWQVFGQLYQNFKGFKLSKISLSKIEINHNDLTSKELEELQPFLNPKQPEIEQINSFIIEKGEQHPAEAYIEKIDSERQKYGQYEGLRIEKRSSYKEYEFRGDRLTSEKSMLKHTPSNNNTKIDNERQTDQLEHKVLVTHKKQVDLIEAGSTQRAGKNTAESQAQYIYLIRDSVKKKGPPSNYIKIPLTTENVKIVQIQTERKKKKKRQVIEQRVSMTEKQCVNCKFCEMSQQRRQIMKRLKERIEIQVRNTNIHTQYIRDNHCHYDKNVEHRHSQHFQGGQKYRDIGIRQFRYEFQGSNGLTLGLQQYQRQKQQGIGMSERIEIGQRSGGNALALSYHNDGHSQSHSSSHCRHNTSYGDGYTLSKGYSYHKTTQFCTK